MPQPRNTTLTARSVLASALMGVEPPQLPVSYLVRLSGLFDMNENRARVALSRMVAAGEVTTDGAGRYRLAGHLLERQQRQAASMAGRTRAWRGDWHVVVVTATGSPPEVRNRRRRSLSLARLAELREGVWLRPDNLDFTLADDVEIDVIHLRSRVDDDLALLERLWVPEQWATGAEELLALLEAHAPREWSDLAPGFELSASVLRHLQLDPLLPRQLLPESWPGERLRKAYADWDRRYRRLLVAWARSVQTPASTPSRSRPGRARPSSASELKYETAPCAACLEQSVGLGCPLGRQDAGHSQGQFAALDLLA